MPTLTRAAAAAILLALPVAGHAAPLSGTFEIDVYNYTAGGSSSNAGATVANVDTLTLSDTFTWDGALDFRIDTRNGPEAGAPTIAAFLGTGTGSATGLDATVGGLTLSTGGGSGDANFGTTTIFDIVATSFDAPLTAAFDGVITHDDGITLLEDGAAIAQKAAPTSETTTTFSFGGGEFRLIYASANGDPSILEVSGTPAPIPLPAGIWLLGAAMAGLFGVSRRRA